MHLRSSPHFPSPLSQPLATSDQRPVTIDLNVQETSYKWNHILWSFVSDFFHVARRSEARPRISVSPI